MLLAIVLLIFSFLKPKDSITTKSLLPNFLRVSHSASLRTFSPSFSRSIILTLGAKYRQILSNGTACRPKHNVSCIAQPILDATIEKVDGD